MVLLQTQRMIRTALSVVLLAGLFALPARADDSRPTVAMLPLANYTAEHDLLDLYRPLIIEQLESHTARLITAKELRPVLRHYRIRAIGGIDEVGARQIQAADSIDYLLLGSIDLAQQNSRPEAALSLRLVDIASMQIVWATTVAGTGDDGVTMLDLGRITDPDILARQLVTEAFADFDRSVAAFVAGRRVTEGPVTALIRFDDFDSQLQSGAVVSTHLLTALVRSGARVCEPGLVSALLLHHGGIARGEIDYKRLRLLHDSLGVDLVLTGYTQQFAYGVGSAATSTPQLELGARLLDAGTGKILRVLQWGRDGRDSEHFFGMGATYALGKLTQAAAKDILKKFGYNHEPMTIGKK